MSTPSASGWLRFSAWLGRIWRAITAAFSRPAPEPVPMPVSPAPPPPAAPPPRPGRVSARRKLRSPMVVPASGHVFTVQVHATFIWSSEGLYPSEFEGGIDEVMPYAIRRLKALAAQHARRHPPHRARELEIELQQVLKDGASWKFSWHGAPLVCQPYVWVELDDQVREAVRPFSEQLIKIDCEHDVQMRRAQYAEKLSRQWTEILTGLMSSPVADGAAEMTEKELAAVVRKIVEEQRLAAEKLEDLIKTKAEGNDMFDRSNHFDDLLERLVRRADRRFEPTGAAAANGQHPQP